jgi:ATP-dependent RNA helicase DDX35
MFPIQVLHIHPSSVMFTRKPRTGWVVFHEMEETKKIQWVVRTSVALDNCLIAVASSIRIITEIEPDW